MSSPAVPLAVVTGGSGVIGSAVVRGFAGAGHRVAVLDRDPLPAELAALAGVEHQVCELAEVDSVERAVAAVTREEPELRFIVGVAGGAIDDEVTAQRDGELPAVAAFRASVEENLMAQYVPLHALLPRLARASGDRAVVLVSSINALGGFGLPAYSAAKAGLIGLMHALTGPLGAAGIRINVVAPGTIPTPKTDAFWGSAATEGLLRYSALGHAGTPDQAAAAVLAVCTALSHVTGHVLVVDGGQLVHRPV